MIERFVIFSFFMASVLKRKASNEDATADD
jgi:hypothetical protein